MCIRAFFSVHYMQFFIKITFFSFILHINQFLLPPLLPSPPLSHLPSSPFTPSPSPFGKRQGSQGLVQSMAHQVEAGPKLLPLC